MEKLERCLDNDNNKDDKKGYEERIQKQNSTKSAIVERESERIDDTIRLPISFASGRNSEEEKKREDEEVICVEREKEIV